MENINKMKDLLNSIDSDVIAFTEKGNKSAGTRIRKAMQEVKSLAQLVRTEVQDAKNKS